MDNQFNQFPNDNYNNGMQVPLPKAQSVLIMGIASIITACCCYGIVGVILGIIARKQAKESIALYNSNPSAYQQKSISNVNVGNTTALIGIILGIITLILNVIVIAIFGFEALTDPTKMQDIIKEMQNQ